jgi:DNA-binding NarL/FixJ family response regulator
VTGAEVDPTTSPPVSVVLIDDHPVVLAGVRAWFAAADPLLEVAAAGADPEVAWCGLGRESDVVVLDLQLSNGRPAYDALQRLVDANRQVIVYTMRDSQDVALRCLNLGAFTYLTKAEGERHLVAATRAAAKHQPYTPPALAGALSSDTGPRRPALAPRETEVLVEWFQCESKVMVAERLGLSVRTVNSYLDRVRIKYANAGRPAATKATLVAKAVQDGLVALEDL